MKIIVKIKMKINMIKQNNHIASFTASMYAKILGFSKGSYAYYDEYPKMKHMFYEDPDKNIIYKNQEERISPDFIRFEAPTQITLYEWLIETYNVEPIDNTNANQDVMDIFLHTTMVHIINNGPNNLLKKI
jgi:hypothetical protein